MDVFNIYIYICILSFMYIVMFCCCRLKSLIHQLLSITIQSFDYLWQLFFRAWEIRPPRWSCSWRQAGCENIWFHLSFIWGSYPTFTNLWLWHATLSLAPPGQAVSEGTRLEVKRDAVKLLSYLVMPSRLEFVHLMSQERCRLVIHPTRNGLYIYIYIIIYVYDMI